MGGLKKSKTMNPFSSGNKKEAMSFWSAFGVDNDKNNDKDTKVGHL